MKRIVNAFLGKLILGKRGYSVFALCAATAIALPAQTLTTLFSFDGTNGLGPNAGLVQATNGTSTGQRLWAGPMERALTVGRSSKSPRAAR